jgi:hypothetical protein
MLLVPKKQWKDKAKEVFMRLARLSPHRLVQRQIEDTQNMLSETSEKNPHSIVIEFITICLYFSFSLTFSYMLEKA